jgi:hypothetical protein
MATVQDIEELQKAADYRSFQKTSRQAAYLGFFVAIIVILLYVIDIKNIQDNPINVIPMALGALLLAGSLWLLIARRPALLIVNGVASCLLGLWFIISLIVGILIERGEPYSAIRNVIEDAWGGESIGFIIAIVIFALIGIVFMEWGIGDFMWYNRFSGISRQQPNTQSIKQFDEIIKEVTKAKPKESKDIILFQESDYFASIFQMKSMAWKGRLLGDIGVFGRTNKMGGSTDNLLTRRDEIQIASKSKVTPGGKPKIVRASFRIGQRNFNGTISSEYLQRYEAWKVAPE